MTGLLSDMKARIEDELSRSDLTSQIATCINDAILIYQKELFRFNETVTATFPTVISQQNYSTVTDTNFAGVATFQQIQAIDWMTVTVGVSNFDMPREQPEIVILLSQTGTQVGQPDIFAFANETIMLYPVPSAVYTITMGAHVVYRAPQSDSETGNRWMTDGERLIRSRAKYELAMHYLKDADLAGAMSPDQPPPGGKAGASYDAYEALKGEANRMTGRGVIRAMQF